MLFNEPKLLKSETTLSVLRGLFGFSALQRAEIAEIVNFDSYRIEPKVSVLFNEPKLLKLVLSVRYKAL